MNLELEHIEAIVGPQRREKLIAAAADRLVLNEGLTPEAAGPYARACWESLDPTVLVAPGQVWASRKGGDPRGALAEVFGAADGSTFRIDTVDRETHMVEDGAGRSINYKSYLGRHYRLAEWPLEHQPGEDTPQPPAAVDDESPGWEEESDGEPEFDPRAMYMIVEREDFTPPADGSFLDGHLAMLGHGYSTQLGRTGKNFVALDVPAYLRANLADYRAGYEHWQATEWANTPGLFHFNTHDGREAIYGTEVAAYLGYWLWQRIRSDAATEHGGTPTDYNPGFPWAPSYANKIIPAVAGADPREPLTADHPLSQCPGQLNLFGATEETTA